MMGPVQKARPLDGAGINRFQEDDTRNYDFAPLYRATVGFDRNAELLDRIRSSDIALPGYLPYSIEKTAEAAYPISIAVAGFSPEELTVEVGDGALSVAAGRPRRTPGAAIRTAALPPEPSSGASRSPIMCG